MIFMAIFRNQSIIKDTGFIKCELILLGLILFFLSINFDIFTNYKNCASYFFLYHSGTLLIYIIFLTYVSTGYELGINYKEFEITNILQNKKAIKRISRFILNKKEEETINDSAETLDEKLIINIEKELNKIESFYNNNRNSQYYYGTSKNYKEDEEIDNYKYYSLISSPVKTDCSSKTCLLNKMDSKKDDILRLNKSIKKIHSLFMEITVMYIIVLIFIVFVIIYNSFNENKEIQQNFDGKWRYNCPLDRFNIIMDLIEFFALINLLCKVLKIWNFSYVFKCVKYIGFASMIWFTNGPLVYLISYFTIYKDNSNSFNSFNTTMNGICYFIIYILYTWDKVYYIIKGKGNDPEKYFYSVKRHEECVYHKSCYCNCTNTTINYDIVIKYINFYKYCSKIIDYSNGKLRYIKMENKNQLKFII
ncbi:hypothetical protein BCR32DRAFT_269397 [Anaeromyces robustus]|uniref:Uncharacterized protein n=1 Tax=Anaeromyces robustus TaxID=1754192 RepID=A0A1Y1X2D9_9FUNG|nr:hypothetical protein BCR32DRAFT_269397 [Anaeromyces robustus]|eukprot:ORX79566.1 hypothetical protein BCR32DRAFT_269397 [Anaeromyces robustus]